MLDKSSIKLYNVEKLRRSIGFVMQEPILWNQTIKQNVLYGKPDASDLEVRKACELANATSFIESNFEELNKEERVKKSKEQLEECVKKQSSCFEKLLEFKDNETLCPLLVELLQKVDKKALTLISDQMDNFIQLVRESSQ